MPLNRKAQIFTWDIILATVIFLIVLGTILLLWTETIEDIDAADTEYEISWLATAVSEQLARTPGSPLNWTRSPNIGNITVLGLADIKRIGNETKTLDRVLDPDKVIAFINITQNPPANYYSLRNRVLGTGKYEFYVEMSCLDPAVLDCFEGLRFDNIANYNITCNASNQTFYISNYTLKSDPYLTAIWRLDEAAETTAADSSANGNDGAIYGASWASGKYQNALSFDGLNDYVNVTSSDSLNSPSSTNKVTVSAWVYPRRTIQQVIVNKDTGIGAVGSGSVYMLELDSSGKIRFHIHNTADGNIIDILNGSYTLNTWQYVAGTFDGTVGRLYVDGVLNTTETGLGGTIYSGSTQDLFIGTLRNTSRFFNGSIDDVKIWSRSLSETEVLQEYLRADKHCRFGRNASMADTSYQIYDSKTVTFRKGRNDTLFDDDTAFLEPTAELKVVVYRTT